MKRFNVLLTLAIAFTMVATAQNAPQGKMLPFHKMTKATSMVTPMRDDVLVTPPATAVVETGWELEGSYINNSTPYSNTNTISVAFDGNDVYIQGMVFLCPDAWVKGTIDEGGKTATFANGQYAGTYNGTSIYFCGSTDGETMDDVLFTYNGSSFELTNYYIENTATDSFSFYFYSYDIVIKKAVAAPSDVEVEPAATTASVGWTENGDATSWNVRYRYMPEPLNYLWDFESVTDLEGWMVLDNDGDNENWTWANSKVNAYSGDGVMTSASYSTEALTPDNWLITPMIPMGGTASFWYAGQDPDYASEVFAVYVANVETLTSLNDFVKVTDDITATGDYQQLTIDLSAYEGYGYIAIRHYNVTDQFWLNIDDFCVEQPGGQYPGEWIVKEDVTDNPYTIEGLTPESNYQVQVQAPGSDWSEVVNFTTLAEAPVIPNVYMLGGDDKDWDPTKGVEFEYNAEENNYTATITFPAEYNFFGFTTMLAEDNIDNYGWTVIAPYRFGAVADEGTDFWYEGQDFVTLTWENYHAIRIAGGEYKLTVDLADMKLFIEKIGAEVVPGDVNNDGLININDVTTLIDHQLNSDFEDADDFSRANADVDGDGEINVGDLAALIDMLLN